MAGLPRQISTGLLNLANNASAHSLVPAEHNPVLVQEDGGADEDPPPEGLGPVYTSVFIDIAGMAMCFPVLPYFILDMPGSSPSALGLAMSVYWAAAVVGSIFMGYLSDTIGRRPVILMSIAGSGLGFLVTAFAPNLTLLIIARSFAGLMGGSIPVAQAYITDVTTDRQRTRYLGFVGATIGIAFTLGPAIGAGLIQIPGFTGQYVLFSAAGFSFLAFLQALLRLKEPQKQAATASAEKHSVIQVLLNSRPLQVLLLACFFANYNFQVMQTLYALMLEAFFGWGSGQLGFILGGAGIVMALVQAVVMAPLLRVFGEVGAAAFACTLLTVFGLLFPFFNRIQVVFLHIPCLLLYVGGYAVTNTAIPSLQASFASPSQRGVILGMSQSVAACSRVVSPILSGYLWEVSMQISQDSGIERGPPFIGFGQLPFAVGAAMSLLSVGLILSIKAFTAPQFEEGKPDPSKLTEGQEMVNDGALTA